MGIPEGIRGNRRKAMSSRHPAERMKLSSEGTVWWRNVFPPIWTTGVGIGMIGLWLEWWGEATPSELKVIGMGIWAVTSFLITLFGRSLYDVWLENDRLVVSRDGRDVAIPLADISGFSETRGQRIKSIKIKLRPGYPLGSSVRFVPHLRLQAPFSEHPVVREVKERKRQLTAGTSDRLSS